MAYYGLFKLCKTTAVTST